MTEGAGESGWGELTRELDAWMTEGWIATLWWRDDDAIAVTDALETMFEISQQTKTPLALAVIPARAGDDLRLRVSRQQEVSVLQHGFAHTNHQPEGSKKSEFGAGRDMEQVKSEIGQGMEQLSEWDSFLPVFVPPWNRMDRRFLGVLAKLGVVGLSCFKARQMKNPALGVTSVNTHVDVIKSQDGGRHFIGVGPALAALIDHLSSRRLGRVDRDEPTGILSHHLDHGEDCWTFLEQLVRLIADHPAGRWLGATEIFNPSPEQETA